MVDLKKETFFPPPCDVAALPLLISCSGCDQHIIFCHGYLAHLFSIISRKLFFPAEIIQEYFIVLNNTQYIILYTGMYF